MSGPCAKTRVVCTIVTPDGRRFVGTNDVLNPQRACPRPKVGGHMDYSMCRDICRQPAHAEINALKVARQWAVGATAYVEHHRCCDPCERALGAAGVREIVLGSPPV